jgi:1-phosphatidylinositol-5-phosphate 4-kinase
MIVGI